MRFGRILGDSSKIRSFSAFGCATLALCSLDVTPMYLYYVQEEKITYFKRWRDVQNWLKSGAENTAFESGISFFSCYTQNFITREYDRAFLCMEVE